jgi:hypothetical protein
MVDHENRSMHRLLHHSHGYAYAVILSYNSWVIMLINW